MDTPEEQPPKPLVVYVDDERANRIVFEANLKADFNIKSVGDAEAALKILASEEVAVLVTDIRMEGMGSTVFR